MVEYRQNITEFDELLKKLHAFRKLYLRNEFLKHVLLFFMAFVLTAFLFLMAESFFYLSPALKVSLLVSFLLLFVSSAVYIVLVFLKKRSIFWQTIDDTFLANLIARKYVLFGDKFINVLCLAAIGANVYSSDLLAAGIVERSLYLNRFAFAEAYNHSYFRRTILFSLTFYLVFAVFYVFKYDSLKTAFYRLAHPTVYFSKPAPFKFMVLNEALQVESQQDFVLRLKLEGDVISDNVSLIVKGKSLMMNRDSLGFFSYTFYGPVNDIDFQMESSGFYSDLYHLSVLRIPVFTSVKAMVKVPEYTGDSSYVLETLSDVLVPEGTSIEFFMKTANADTIFINENSELFRRVLVDNALNYKKNFKHNTKYQFALSNADIKQRNPLEFNVTVVKDRFPLIDVLKYVDSVNVYAHYFYGRISDDYGFSMLRFKYRIKGESWSYLPIQFVPNLFTQEVMLFFDFASLKKNSTIEYAFQVYDNDRVNGAKLTESAVFVFQSPGTKELSEIQEKATKALSGLTNQTQSVLQELRQSMEDLSKSTTTEKLDQWEMKQKLEELEMQKEKLEKLVKEIQEKFENKTEMEKFLEQSDDLLAKQKEIQELFEKLMDEEMMKLFDELKNLENEFEQSELNALQEQLDNKLEDLQKELERNLELLKRYEVERDVEQQINELNELAEMQQNAADSIQKFKNQPEMKSELIKEMEQKLNEINQEYQDILKKNEALKEPMPMDNFSQEFDSIQQNFQDQKENNNRRDLKNEMQQNQENIQNLAEKMSQMMDQAESQQLDMSIEELRQILDNIVEFSFKQEELLNEMNNVSLDNPKYIDLIQKQQNLERDFSIIQDSLFSISEQIPQIASLIKEDIRKIREYGTEAVNHFEARRINSGRTAQQFIMTSANNLALFLNESLESLKNMQKNASQGKNGKPQPQNGEPGLMQMQQQQQSLKQQMQKMIDDMKSGKLKKGDKEFSKRLAEILAQQEILQQMLNQMQMNGELSPNAQKMLQEVKDLLKKNEVDIVNKNITPELLNRQQEILTRLLEADNAENEREKEEKRESETGENNIRREVEFDWEKFNKSLFRQEFHQNQLNLLPFYKQLYEKYQTKEK